jgi:predicted PurR-regulated permease PerM
MNASLERREADNGMSAAQATGWLRDHSSRIMTAGIILALLYLGRSVLIPLALAIMLSLLVAPLIRALRRLRIGRASSVLVAVAALTVLSVGVAAALGTQVLHIAESLPQYESNVQRKLKTLEEVIVDPILKLTNETSRLTGIQQSAEAPAVAARDVERSRPAAAPGVAVFQPPEFESDPLRLVWKLLTTVWHPVQFAGIVLLVLIFVLLEYESLRDRFIRIAGSTDIRSATLALNDAGDRLSRYFVSQFAVNLAFGLAIWMSLGLLRLPQALLCGILAGAMRFVPYVGVAIAALFAAVLALAVDPGWSLALSTLGVFILLDIVVGQLVEPHLYGHATGLSPLSVVVGAIFWSWLWGPAGLILSTPLTLCLLVAGRHMKGFGVLELLLGNARPLTLPQRFYQRALSGDSHEIIADAGAFLKNNSLAAYCDRVMIPALHLVRLDAEAGATSGGQQPKIRGVIVDVASALSGNGLKFLQRRNRGAVLQEVSAGRWLRQQREQLSGKWQGPLGVPRGSIVTCIALGSPADDLATELLVRLLRSEKIDARHFSTAEIDAGLPPGADPDGVAIAFLVSAYPSPERERADSISLQLHELLPQASLIRVFCPGLAALPESGNSVDHPETTANSLGEAIEICMSWQEVCNKRDVSSGPQRADAVRTAPHAAHPTEQADCPHSALGQDAQAFAHRKLRVN